MTEQLFSSSQEKEDKQKKSLSFLINLISECVERGGYTIADVIKINESINDFTKNEADEEAQKKSILTLINYVQISQSKGKLSLQEAYEAYQSINCFKQN